MIKIDQKPESQAELPDYGFLNVILNILRQSLIICELSPIFSFPKTNDKWKSDLHDA